MRNLIMRSSSDSHKKFIPHIYIYSTTVTKHVKVRLSCTLLWLFIQFCSAHQLQIPIWCGSRDADKVAQYYPWRLNEEALRKEKLNCHCHISIYLMFLSPVNMKSFWVVLHAVIITAMLHIIRAICVNGFNLLEFGTEKPLVGMYSTQLEWNVL